ncbi:MAG: PLP-dependent aminotransferase family protein [Actinomycetota bacterium]|nr:PLP-dependent aminotransferase family protein [Actinomycetota bacterium]
MSSTLPPVARRMTGVESSPVRDLLALTARPGVISFAGGLPAPELFDTEGLRAAYDRALTGPDARRNLQYSPTEGSQALRERLADRLTTRGLPTTADQLLITTGSQQAVTLVTAALIDPGSLVLVEQPTYLAALQCFQLAGATIRSVESDEHGLVPESLRAVLAEVTPAALYLTPTFGNPTGRTLTEQRRREVAELAVEHGFWIIEDDPYSELRFEGSEVPTIASMPIAPDRTIYLGTFSKTAAPGLRLGWARVAGPLIKAITVVKQASDLHTSTIDQAAAAMYLESADLDAHVAILRKTYRDRRDAMLEAIARTLPEGSSWSRPDGGMFIWATLPDGLDSGSFLPAALANQVAFVPGWPFFAEQPNLATLRLSYTTHTPDEIEEGMRRLAKVFQR